jgi:GntR family transcriptional regulator
VSWRIDPGRETPPSGQLVEAVLDRVARGELAAGDRLPSMRTLAAEALVNPNTVGKAYRDLEHLGVVAGRNGSGVYVTEAGPALAREARRAATARALDEAVHAALRAGHRAQEIELAVARVLEREIATEGVER